MGSAARYHHITMGLFSIVLVAAFLFPNALCAFSLRPTETIFGQMSEPIITIGPPPNQLFIHWQADDPTKANFNTANGSSYSVQWSSEAGQVVGGKGWRPGTASRVIQYSGLYRPNGNSTLSVYGWTRNPLVEYYIVESYDVFEPPAAQKLATVTCDEATYDLYITWRYNAPSIDGIRTFQQVWSVRTPKKASGGTVKGTVTVSCHANAWRGQNIVLGSHDYQILATHGYRSSGQAILSVSA